VQVTADSNAFRLQPIAGSAWLNGFVNLLRRELRSAFGGTAWMVQAAVWMLLLNGLLALILVVATRLDPSSSGPEGPVVLGTQSFMSLASIVVAIGIGILGQGTMIGERQGGTAAWVLTKPVSRSAFVLAKSVGLLIQSLILAVLMQGAVAFTLITGLTGSTPAPFPFAFGLLLVALHSLLYVALVVMLGTLFRSQGQVIGLIVGLIFAQGLIASFLPALTPYVPYAVAAQAAAVGTGQPMPSTHPVWITVILTVGCLITAISRFEQEEL